MKLHNPLSWLLDRICRPEYSDFQEYPEFPQYPEFDETQFAYSHWLQVFSSKFIDVNILMECSAPIIRYLETGAFFVFKKDIHGFFFDIVYERKSDAYPLICCRVGDHWSSYEECECHSFFIDKKIGNISYPFFYTMTNKIGYLHCTCYYTDLCDGKCIRKEEARYRESANVALKKYLQELFPVLNLAGMREFITQNAPSEFVNDFNEIEKKVLEKNMTFKAAEESLLVWKDAADDIFLQKAFLLLRYSYITYISRDFILEN